ncbi:hypothetical protein PENNAL_c0011G08108 [Penicillium nalgiovense]|uniref:Uncharacterized protein n=1 Tax=Penicillium nalgiovense TaxID=60175 RepID=A0A1V6YTA2_PENNA|nr:hypothetical protein PENNAL_c0011G08108 [Penicillium nalgiovense]
MDDDARGDYRWGIIEELRTQALFSRDMIQIDPSKWGASPDDDSGFEESHTMATESPQQLVPDCRNEVPALQSKAQEQLPRIWALANAAAAAPTAIDSSSHMEPASELAHIPSSDTGCQWSAILFERYFQVLGSEQTPAL